MQSNLAPAACSTRRPEVEALTVRMHLWSVWHDRPLCWACNRGHDNTMLRPWQLPSISRFSRWVKTGRVRQMLPAVNAYLTRTPGPIGLSFLDGKPRSISLCSHEPDARVGWATKRFAKGHKLHAWATADDRIPRCEVRPMNEGEAKVERRFGGSICGGLVLSDADYDTKKR